MLVVKIPLYLQLIRFLIVRYQKGRKFSIQSLITTSTSFGTVCTYGRRYLTRDNSIFSSVALRISSCFKGFLHCDSKVLSVVQRIKCFVLKWETARRLFICVVEKFFILRCRLCRQPLLRPYITFFTDLSSSRISKAS